MNLLKYMLSAATLKNRFFNFGKSNQLAFFPLLVCLLLVFQSIAGSERDFALNVDLTIYPATCGEENGAITTTVSGGVPPYTYMWSNGETSTGIVNLGPGDYSVTVTDGVGNTATASGTIIAYPALVISSVVVIEASCGNADGAATVNVVGDPLGTIYTYDWSANVGNSTDNQAFNLSSGVYSVTVTDPSQPVDCSIIETFSVGNVDGPETTLVTTGSVCGEDNGSATFGNPDYDYEWSPDLGTPNPEGNIRTDLPAGTYFVTITDPLNPGCDNVKTVVIEEIPSVFADYTINNLPDCGLANGSVTINGSGGSGNYSYSWGNATMDNLPAGVYEVTVTDVETGCTGSVIFTLLDNSGGATLVVDDVDIDCAGDMDGFVNYTATYDPGFVFPADTTILNSNGTEFINGNLSPGSYCIVITDANGCFSGGDCFEIENPTQIDVDIAIIDKTCTELGAIMVEVDGGAGGYTYEWNPAQSPSGPTASNLDLGSYSLTVTDANGCSIAIDGLVIDDDCPCPPVIVDGLLIIKASCGNADGSAYITVDGGPAGFIYTWSPNVTNSNGPFAYDLEAGTYSVTVADETSPDDCFIIETFTVGNIDGPDVSYEVTPTSCGQADGTVTFSNQTYQYSWNPDIGTVLSNYERVDLPSGEYYITVTDPNDPDCPDVITVVVEELDGLTVTVTVNQEPDCMLANGSVTINVAGGSGNYTYSWGSQTMTNLEAGNYEVTVTDDDTGCTGSVLFTLINSDPDATLTINSISELLCPGDEDATVDYTVVYGAGFAFPETIEIVDLFGNVYTNGTLSPGDYCINIYDANGCLEASECFTIEAATQINVIVEIVDEVCDSLGSIALVDVNGGAGGYIFEWDPAVSVDSSATNLEPGIYEITVTDANGCFISGELPVEADTNKITIDLMPDTLICDTSIIIGATITPPGATVVWTDQDGNPFDPDLPVTPVDTSIYYVEVTSGDCFAMDSVMIIEGAVNIMVEYDTIACVGTDSMISIVNLDLGDTLMYNWSPDSLIVIDGNEHTGFPTINTEVAGDYTIFYDISNQFGCSAQDSIEIMVVDSIVVDTIISTMQCDSLTVDFSIPANPFVTYVWNFGDPGNPGGAIGTNVSHDYSAPDCYTVTLILLPNSNASCFERDTLYHEVCVIDPPIFDLGIDVSIECNDDGAEVTLGDTSTSPLGEIIAWDWTIDGNPVSMDSVVVIDVPQSDTLDVEVIVTNEEGCMDTLMQLIPINIIDIPFPDSILACEDDFIQLYGGADTLLIFEWMPPEIFDDPNDPHAIAHITEDVIITVAISDTANMYFCPQEDTIIVIVADTMNLVALGDSIFCDDLDAPTLISAECVNCDPNLIEWSLDNDFDVIEGTGPTLGNQIDPLNPDIYYVRIENDAGCVEMDSVVLFLDLIPLAAPPDPIELCFGDTLLISISPLDSVTWTWEGENIIETENPNEILVIPGESQYYVYSVIDEFGCVATDSASVEVVDLGDVVATADPTEICIYETSQLNVNQIPGATYEWSNEETLDNSTIEDPVATPLETTTYTVTVTDEESGCAAVSETTITVVRPACEEPYVFFPNAFTPNDDGHNDVLYLRGTDVTDVYFIIYNRWGEKMFESNSQSQGWDGTFDGKKLGADAYGYYLKVRCGNGEEFIKKGNVTILR